MAKIDPIALHPISGLPYEKIRFVRMNAKRIPLYAVDEHEGECGAAKALDRAFRLYGGQCFYCQTNFQPQAFSTGGAHRDHVVADSSGGSERLHNLVVACQACGSRKSNKPLRKFRPEAADRYLAVLERHIANALGARAGKASRSS
jgi:5-methylcytosine-specific restriction endonuclease McrA